MSPQCRDMDRMARSLSEVVCCVGEEIGQKTKDADAGLELGEKENRCLLDKARDVMRAENERRQVEEGAWIEGELNI